MPDSRLQAVREKRITQADAVEKAQAAVALAQACESELQEAMYGNVNHFFFISGNVVSTTFGVVSGFTPPVTRRAMRPSQCACLFVAR